MGIGDDVDWTACFKCNNKTFEIMGPGVPGRVRLKCKKCGYEFSKPRTDVKIENGVVTLLPSRRIRF